MTINENVESRASLLGSEQVDGGRRPAPPGTGPVVWAAVPGPGPMAEGLAGTADHDAPAARRNALGLCPPRPQVVTCSACRSASVIST
jgi:hypothetical protein